MTIETDGGNWSARGGGSTLGMLLGVSRRAAGTAVLFGIAASAVALATWNVSDPSLSVATGEAPTNWLGVPGAVTADLLMQVVGLGALCFLLVPLAWGLRMRGGNRAIARHDAFGRVGSWLLGTGFASAALSALPGTTAWPLPTGLGGIVGDLLLRPFQAMSIAPEGFASLVLAVPLALAARSLLRAAIAAPVEPEAADGADVGRFHALATVAIGSLAHSWLVLRALGQRLVRGARTASGDRREPEAAPFDADPAPVAVPSVAVAQPAASIPPVAPAMQPVLSPEPPSAAVPAVETPVPPRNDWGRTALADLAGTADDHALMPSDWTEEKMRLHGLLPRRAEASQEIEAVAAPFAPQAVEPAWSQPVAADPGPAVPAAPAHGVGHPVAAFAPAAETSVVAPGFPTPGPHVPGPQVDAAAPAPMVRPTVRVPAQSQRIGARSPEAAAAMPAAAAVPEAQPETPAAPLFGATATFASPFGVMPMPVASLSTSVLPEPGPAPAAAPVEVAAPMAPEAPSAATAPAAPVAPVQRVLAPSAPSASLQPAARPAQELRQAPTGVPDVFTLPSIEFLRPKPATGVDPNLDEDVLRDNAAQLESVLGDFGVKGQIIDVQPGPVVTMYLLEPAPGIKSSRVIGLAEDIARSMSAIAARVAVVPGRNAIGIELPNVNREVVMLRELAEQPDFTASKHKLALTLGKDIGGAPVVADLAKMPHLLVAGTTGSGKSVAINTMILSLLYRLTPEECRLIMIDPKMLELSVYDGIPHLLSPVVTDPKKAVVALKWCVREMEERYKKMAKLGVRNIGGYNERVKEAAATGERLSRTVQTGFDRSTGEAVYETEELNFEPMPFIVVIIDEMADLMMVAGKDIEGAVQRLAQMARAAGIHVVMATQRPSTDVITGTIKANFPTRISFQVTSKVDSRVMLGESGAEQLLGMGDMLYMTGGGRTQRVHGPFVSDEEVEAIVGYLKTQGVPDYLDDVTLDDEEDEAADVPVADNGAATAMEESDDPYDQAVALVMRDGKASTSYVQRRLGIGYNRAASLIERMEKEGLISPPNSGGKREILMDRTAEET